MGINGLLQFIKDAGEPVNVKKYKGQTVAVDTYCWLHKGAYCCSEKLAKGEPTDQYVWYCMKFVDMLLNFGVKPILVFDGRNLPSKKEVEKLRRERREVNLQKGKRLLREGKPSQARDCFNRCVNITPAMAHNLIKTARARGVDCVVAPYEADAQLAFLTKSGLAEAVITEDSDLLAFGCKKVILKMDKAGNGFEINQSNLGRCRSLGNVFTEEKFRYMCILSGCDYLPSLHGIGLGKACKLLRLAKDPDILKVIRKMGQYLKMDLVVPDVYIEGFVRANNTFLYQLVFDPTKRKVVPLNPYPDHIDPRDLSYAGSNIGDEKGLQMALGNLDPNTLEQIDNFCPDKPLPKPSKPSSHSWNDSSSVSKGTSIWSRRYSSLSSSAADPSLSSEIRASTRGQQREVSVGPLRLPCRELQVKRPREDAPVSDQDVLLQYSSNDLKRPRSEEYKAASVTPTAAPHRPRNCFSTLLQRRNQASEPDGAGTCSRFFSSSSAAAALNTSAESEPSPSCETMDSDGPDVPSVDTPSPRPAASPPAAASPPPAASTGSRGLRLFHRSSSSLTEPDSTPQSTSGLAVLKRFRYTKENTPSSSKPQSPVKHRGPEETEDVPDSPPSQDSAYFSQSSLTSCNRQEALCCSLPSSNELNSDREREPSETTRKPSTLRSKVAGLSRPNPAQTQKLRVLGPARVSGLKRKSVLNKGSSQNNENSPGVQATISGLWRNFSFKKDSQKLSSCRKEPLSPAKDNCDSALVSSC